MQFFKDRESLTNRTTRTPEEQRFMDSVIKPTLNWRQLFYFDLLTIIHFQNMFILKQRCRAVCCTPRRDNKCIYVV
jgi:hypothetical protein